MSISVFPASRLRGRIILPPDKSISHRSALFGALHEGVSEIRNYSKAADPQSTLSCLRQLGVRIQFTEEIVRIEGRGLRGFDNPEEPLDCGNSGTTMRLLTGIVAGAGVRCTLTGDESLSARTMKRIIDPLRKMGSCISAREDVFAPLNLDGNSKLQGIKYELPIASAQVKSCVLLAGLFAGGITEVIETIPSRDHTERLLNLPVIREGGKTIIRSVPGHEVPNQSYEVPSDFSAAAFWLVAGSVHPNAELLLPNVGMNPSRIAALDVLRKMGAEIYTENETLQGYEPVADIRVCSSKLRGFSVPEEWIPNCIDEIPALSVAMGFAEGESQIRNAGELRHKETDRIMAVAKMLYQAGIAFQEFPDGFIIKGNPKHTFSGNSYQSFHDHRIAMAAAMLALSATSESVIDHPECAGISYPDFWKDVSAVSGA